MGEKSKVITLGEWDIPLVDSSNASNFIDALNSTSPDTVIQMTVDQLIRVLNKLWVETETSEFSREKFIESIHTIPEKFSKRLHTDFLKVFRDRAGVIREDGSFESLFWNILLLSKQDLRAICLWSEKKGSKNRLWESFCNMLTQLLKESGHVFPNKSEISINDPNNSFRVSYDIYRFLDYCHRRID